MDAELHRFDRVAVRGWQIAGASGVVAGVVFASTLSATLGLACAATAGAYLAWFLLLGWRMRRVALRGPLLAVTVLVEATIPWVFMAVLVFTQGPGYALASWVPPMLFCGLVISHTVRLRATASLCAGLLGAITFPVLYLVLMRDDLPPDLAAMILYQPPMQVSRAISLAAAGAIGMIVARGLRNAIGRAEIIVRQHELFGKYRIVRPLASGGMGAVFEALYCPEGGFERRVALKRIHPQLVEQKRFVEGFRAEAEISSRLAHPNIVQVLDFGRVGDAYFLAMELVDGMPLSRFVTRANASRLPIPPQVVGIIGREMLAGLVHAHEVARGADGGPLRVVHRDMCPQNVLLSRNGETKITDFGVARALRDSAASHTQNLVGHTAYVAPEQARGQPIDPRSDLFPVGIMLWEMLAGRRLFHRSHESETLLALLYEDVLPITVMRPDVDARWDGVIARALARDPVERWPTAREMALALDAIPEAVSERATQQLAELVELLDAVPADGDDEVSDSTGEPTAVDMPSDLPPAPTRG
jgi:serine/threonine-protein kinase